MQVQADPHIRSYTRRGWFQERAYSPIKNVSTVRIGAKHSKYTGAIIVVEVDYKPYSKGQAGTAQLTLDVRAARALRNRLSEVVDAGERFEVLAALDGKTFEKAETEIVTQALALDTCPLCDRTDA